MSKDLCVFTTGTNLDLLRASCQRVMITLHEYDAKWSGYVSVKVRAAIEFIKGREESAFMWVDGNDSLILRDESSILSRWGSLSHPLIISAEKNCWPDSNRDKEYYQVRIGLSDRPIYVNAGAYIGMKNEVLQALHWLDRWSADNNNEDDQRAWTSLYLSQSIPLTLDHTRYLFASVGDGDEALKADSCIKHWNGRVGGRKEYWEQICTANQSTTTQS